MTQDVNDLRWIATAYEQSQRMRVQTGERIRALLQGRHAEAVHSRAPGDPTNMLARIRKGEVIGPSRFLATMYRMQATAEEAAQATMREALDVHPAWPWLSDVKGVGATLACRLLARLDPVRASAPSAFWAYCGLATVPGREYACETCGRTVAHPVEYRVSGVHRRLRGRARCPDLLRPSRGPADGVRVAQPRYTGAHRPSYNPDAKQVCYLICVSFLRCGGPYAVRYREARTELEETRPGWEKGRIHLTAIRKTEKLFLSHLWLVWREAIGLPVTVPNGMADPIWLDPWRMTGDAVSVGPDHGCSEAVLSTDTDREKEPNLSKGG